MEAKDAAERSMSTEWCKQAAEYLPTDVLRIIYNMHPASAHHRAWGRVQTELREKKPKLGRIMFNDWNGMTMVTNNSEYAKLKYHYAERNYTSGSTGKLHLEFYQILDRTLLEKGKAITSDLLSMYMGIAMHETFSIPQIYIEKWGRIKHIYRMHTQLLRYYDYDREEEDDYNESRNKKKKKKKKNKKKSIHDKKEKKIFRFKGRQHYRR